MAIESKQFLEKTVKVWQEYASTPLSLDDGREIADNMTAFFELLLKLEKKYGEKEKTV